MQVRSLLAWWIAASVACGGGGGGNDGASGDGPPTADAPPPDQPLADRLVVSSVATPAGVMAGRGNWRIWGIASLRISPVFTVPFPDCGTLVGYTTDVPAVTARVARLDASDQLITTHDLGPYELRGLAAEPDGHFAALLWDTSVSPAQLRVSRFDAAGAPGWTAILDDALAAPTDFQIGESRLEYGDGRYGAYFHVHGISGFADGHEGDAFHWIDAASGGRTVGWAWGCSHSMSELVSFDPQTTQFLSACVTDCFPGTSNQAQSIGGIYLDRYQRVIDLDAGCNGSVAGELGSAAPSGAGWKLVFNTHQNPPVPGPGSYNPSTMNQDVGFVSIATGLAPGSVVWLTTTPGNEANSSIARWRPAGDPAEQYVVGWVETAGARYRLARVSPAGAFLEAPIDITAAARWGERDDPFRTHRNSDVVWAWFDASGDMMFRLARLRSGQPPSCTTL